MIINHLRPDTVEHPRLTLASLLLLALVCLANAADSVEPAAGNLPPPDERVNWAFRRPVTIKTPAKMAEAADPEAALRSVLKSGRLLQDKMSNGVVRGWGKDMPVIYLNPTDQPVKSGAIPVPVKTLMAHPGPGEDAAIGWRSPVDGRVAISLKIARGDAGGDGVTWRLLHFRQAGSKPLAAGELAGKDASISVISDGDAPACRAVAVAKGDVVLLVVGKRRDIAYDNTRIEWSITQTDGPKTIWDPVQELTADIHAGNPHADSAGNAGVWYFLAYRDPEQGREEQMASNPAALVDGVRLVGGCAFPVSSTPEVDEWIEIDLGRDLPVTALRIFPVPATARGGIGAPDFPVDYTISLNREGGAYAVAKTVTGQVNPGIAPVLAPLGQQPARYVKLAVTKVGEPTPDAKNYALRLAEIEILGPDRAGPAVRQEPLVLPKTHWRLATDDTALAVAVEGDRAVLYDLRPARGDWNWLPQPTPVPLPTSLQVAGAETRPVTWNYSGAAMDTSRGKRLTLTFACREVPEVEFHQSWWAAQGRGPIESRETVVNRTGKRIVLAPRRELFDLCVKSDQETVLWRFHKDAGAPAQAKALYWDLLAGGTRHNADIMAGGQGGGFGFIPLVVLDSGRHGLYVAGEWQDGPIQVSASGEAPVLVRVLKPGHDHLDVPGASLALPAVYLGAFTGRVDHGCNGLKRWFFTHKSPAQVRDDPTEPWTQFVAWWSRKPGWVQYQEVFAKAMKERLSDTGFESVCIDHGWWTPKKDLWTADPERWPDGMQIAGRLARENGFKLMLYFMGCDSSMEWGKRLSQAMKEYGATTYRSDFGAPAGPAGMAMLDWLIANHPGFRYEHCDCGAPQKDFVMAQRASGIYGIDVYDPLSNRKMFHVSSYCLPPVQLQCPIDDIFTAPVYALRSSMQGAMYIGMGFGKGAMPSECPALIEPMKTNVALYKTRLRPLIRGGDLYHITLRPDGVAWDGLQYQHPVSGKGAVLLFKPASKADTRRFYLRGLDRAKTYALTFQDRPEQNLRKTGAELMDEGFDVTLPGQHVSEIIWIDAGQS